MTPQPRKRAVLISPSAQDRLLMCALICALLMGGLALAGCSTTSNAPMPVASVQNQSGSELSSPATPVATEATPLWAGIPLDDLNRLNLSGLALSEQEDAWRARTAQGDLVRVYLFDSRADAEVAFDFHSVAASSMPTRSIASTAQVGDEATGDGKGLLVLRDRNVVLIVQSPADSSAATAKALVSELVTDAPDGILQERTVDGDTIEWNRVGRRVNTRQ